MLTLTERARQAIQSLTRDGPSKGGVRLVTEPAGGDESPRIDVVVAVAPEPGDAVIEEDGARLFLEPVAARLIGDRTLDADIDQAARQIDFSLR